MAFVYPIGGTLKDQEGSHVRYALSQPLRSVRHALLPYPPEQAHARPNADSMQSFDSPAPNQKSNVISSNRVASALHVAENVFS
jgi:hypothetical protein